MQQWGEMGEINGTPRRIDNTMSSGKQNDC